MDKISCLRAFVKVVEVGGFSAAARRLGVSKAQISKQVGQLEAELGVRLLHRTTRRVSASSDGQAYFERCRPLLAELDELDTAVRSNDVKPRGELRVTAPIAFTELYLMPAVSDFSRRYPEVRLILELTDRFVDLVEERIDVAIRIGRLHESSLVARKLGSMSMLLCAAPDYLAIHGEPTQVAELAHHACVLDNNYPGGTHWTLGRGENTVRTEVNPRIVVNSARAARTLLLAGHGIGYLPSFAVTDDLAQGRLKHLLPNYVPEPVGIFALYPHRKHLSAKVRLFIDMAMEHGKALSVTPPQSDVVRIRGA